MIIDVLLTIIVWFLGTLLALMPIIVLPVAVAEAVTFIFSMFSGFNNILPVAELFAGIVYYFVFEILLITLTIYLYLFRFIPFIKR